MRWGGSWNGRTGSDACCDRFAVGCGVRETLGANRGIPLAKLLRGWPCACRCAPAPASPPQRFAGGPTARAALRGTRTTAPPPAPKPVAAAKCANSPSIGTSRATGAPRSLSVADRERPPRPCVCRVRRPPRPRAHAHHVPRVARSARGRPAAASAWAPRSISAAPCPTARAASGEGVLPDAARACTPTRAQSSPEAATVRAVRLHAWHPTKCR